jgi:IS5 family transposase
MQEIRNLNEISCNMLGKLPPHTDQADLFRSRLTSMINLNHPLVVLSYQIDWSGIERDLAHLYSDEGRPSIPIRSITSVLILKHMFNESDESVIDRWIENPYWQYFSGEQYFQNEQPFDPSEFVHFRKRIGENGLESILSYTVRLHRNAEKETEVQVDTTVQEKNITFPTDAKLARKIIQKCLSIAAVEGIELRQSYRRVVKQLMKDQYNGKHPSRIKKARKAIRKLKTIAGRLVRELKRKIHPDLFPKHAVMIDKCEKILNQKRQDKNKIYSLHEPHVSCIAKGKAHKQYEFGNVVAIVKGAKSGVITAVKSFQGNPHDSRTLDQTLAQSTRVRIQAGGKSARHAVVDRGYRGINEVNGVTICIPNAKKHKTAYEKSKARKRFRARASIEPVISHLKYDNRMIRNYLKGHEGNINNALLAGIGFNLRKKLNKIKVELAFLWNLFINRIRFIIQIGLQLSSDMSSRRLAIQLIRTGRF